MIVCAGGSESFAFARPLGIGPVQAAAELARLCERERPGELIFIGSCGLYAKDPSQKDPGKILKIHPCIHAFNVEFAGPSQGFYSPAATEINLADCEFQKDSQALAHAAAAGGAFLRVNSSAYICASSAAAVRLAALGLDAENMEAFAVLSLAKKYEIPALCLLCVSNFCDEAAHEDFVKNHPAAKAELEKYLVEGGLL